MNEDVSLFNLELPTLVSLPDNDMIDEYLNDTLLRIKMSVPAENLESCRCVLVYISTYVHAVKIANIY